MSDYQGLRVGDIIPMAPASDGQAWIPAAVVVQLLRAIADGHRGLADDPECDLRSGADAIEAEADAIEVRAIMQTR
ncbi:hypothetical protein [Streptomyces filamentosus]|uniref:hypothetical protein n=1 Tax=Streptomyces filamentosus TaxID=67294 RepID=UPI001238E972|nr:hypothetical protein [Streptomyces filamentosus]KAA6216428.1 hypothetical protein CP979_05310 [Streptomyces filamentosus]